MIRSTLLILAILAIQLFLFLKSFGEVWGAVLTVSDRGGINTLAEAIYMAGEGDTVIVNPGVYKEFGVIIDKPLTISGIGNPVIDAELKGDGIIIRHSGVNISGLDIRNIDVSYMNELSGIRVESSDNCVIKDCRFDNTFFAVYLAGSKNCLVSGNQVKGYAKTESSSGNGIHLWKCSGITVTDNQITGHRDGIYLEFASSSVIERNTSGGNMRYGLHFMFSDSSTYSGNTFEMNGAGVAVMYSKNIYMYKNRFQNNWGDASYGLLLKELYDGILEGNTFYNNTSGIHLEGSNRIVIEHNEFRENGWALNILGNCYDNEIRYNNFFNNTFDISSNSSRSNNTFEGNYWDKYKGYDLDRDGTGDVPFRPVSLFSVIIEKSPESIIMLRSVIADLLDAVERIVPSLIPDTLIDEKPSIMRIDNDNDTRS